MHYVLIVSSRSGRKAWSRGVGLDTPALSELRQRHAHVDRGYMNRTVSWELKHIPKGERGSLQNFLRLSYNALRRRYLTLNRSRHETLRELVDKIRKAHPDFNPEYDKEYFRV